MQQTNQNAATLPRVEPIVVVWCSPSGAQHRCPLRLPRAQACAAVVSLMLRSCRMAVSA